MDPTTPEDCTRCGACCFSNLSAYVPVRGEDHARMGEAAERFTHFVGNRCYMQMQDGHCAALEIRDGRFLCTVYELRPDTCRTLERGSPACAADVALKGEKAYRVLTVLP